MLGGNRSHVGDSLLANAEYVGIDPEAHLLLNIAEFVESYNTVNSIPGEQIETDEINMISRALDLCPGDLLTGCYEDWCVCER